MPRRNAEGQFVRSRSTAMERYRAPVPARTERIIVQSVPARSNRRSGGMARREGSELTSKGVPLALGAAGGAVAELGMGFAGVSTGWGATILAIAGLLGAYGTRGKLRTGMLGAAAVGLGTGASLLATNWYAKKFPNGNAPGQARRNAAGGGVTERAAADLAAERAELDAYRARVEQGAADILARERAVAAREGRFAGAQAQARQ